MFELMIGSMALAAGFSFIYGIGYFVTGDMAWNGGEHIHFERFMNGAFVFALVGVFLFFASLLGGELVRFLSGSQR